LEIVCESSLVEVSGDDMIVDDLVEGVLVGTADELVAQAYGGE